jgi:hypothetical protein
VARESAATWQQRLDQDGTVVIRSSQRAAMWILLGCAALILLGLSLVIGGGVVGIVVGLLMIGAGGFGLERIVRIVRSGQPRLVVTPERLAYGRQSVPWSEVYEVVRHTMTVRGDTSTYVWVLHGGRHRLRLPGTLRADMAELGGWLSEVHARRSREPS